MSAGVPYTHRVAGQARSIAGYYELEREELLSHQGERYLYLLGTGVVETSCCGIGGCYYAMVPGRVLAWHSAVDDDGSPISLLEPVRTEELRAALSREIKGKESVDQVVFL